MKRKTRKELPETYVHVGVFSEGLAPAQLAFGGEKFHIRPDGTRAYPNSYGSVGRFFEGLARVQHHDKGFHIGHDGKPAYKQRYDVVGHFINGRAWAMLQGQQFHILHNGEPAYSHRWIWVTAFSEEGKARVCNEDGIICHIRFDGKILGSSSS